MPRTRQEQRSEETKKNIVDAAEKLFSEHGYEAVTMREIAKEAGCSHTTIYIYFKDKEALLHQLSVPPLERLKRSLQDILERKPEQSPADTEPTNTNANTNANDSVNANANANDSAAADACLNRMTLEVIRFCLTHRTMHSIFFTVKSVRVDAAEPISELNQLRTVLFGQLRQGVRECLPYVTDDELLACSRVYFYMLLGIVSTYVNSEETADELMGRLNDTFQSAISALLYGWRTQYERGADRT
ncbi:TetR/AcrR family transcriptional regulator [Paenibacillus koleovorans]|uniref:TetR/AcrR family transcriptional regulator n=1 Tax=Paenibacillus koleovorans TaxID=121608 RepID=UPI000FDBBF20|nr:TetR/AcrR family transcriptional regulator [Paenibacillus koleovorans]